MNEIQTFQRRYIVAATIQKVAHIYENRNNNKFTTNWVNIRGYHYVPRTHMDAMNACSFIDSAAC